MDFEEWFKDMWSNLDEQQKLSIVRFGFTECYLKLAFDKKVKL